jgi:N-acetylglucosaminyldiphosphoundecaprenol N-acetyl-beta-D-mannosaminyltransferase
MEPVPTPITESRAPSVAAGVRKREILGIPMAMTDYDGAMDVMDQMVDRRERGWVCAAAVHSVMVAQDDPGMRTALTDSVITVPDGMPVVWAANLMGENLPNRVYGPELMQRYCARSAERGLRVWLYGGRDPGSRSSAATRLPSAPSPRRRTTGSPSRSTATGPT